MTKKSIFNRLAFDRFSVAERDYLIANGWEQDGDSDSWSNEDLERKSCRQKHAVNVQRRADGVMMSAVITSLQKKLTSKQEKR